MIRPFCGSMTSPLGSAGEMDQVGKLPVLVGINGLMVASKVKECVLGEYAIEGSWALAIEIVTTSESEPAELVAVIV